MPGSTAEQPNMSAPQEMHEVPGSGSIRDGKEDQVSEAAERVIVALLKHVPSAAACCRGCLRKFIINALRSKP